MTICVKRRARASVAAADADAARMPLVVARRRRSETLGRALLLTVATLVLEVRTAGSSTISVAATAWYCCCCWTRVPNIPVDGCRWFFTLSLSLSLSVFRCRARTRAGARSARCKPQERARESYRRATWIGRTMAVARGAARRGAAGVVFCWMLDTRPCRRRGRMSYDIVGRARKGDGAGETRFGIQMLCAREGRRDGRPRWPLRARVCLARALSTRPLVQVPAAARSNEENASHRHRPLSRASHGPRGGARDQIAFDCRLCGSTGPRGLGWRPAGELEPPGGGGHECASPSSAPKSHRSPRSPPLHHCPSPSSDPAEKQDRTYIRT